MESLRRRTTEKISDNNSNGTSNSNSQNGNHSYKNLPPAKDCHSNEKNLDYVFWTIIFISLSIGYLIGSNWQESCEESIFSSPLPKDGQHFDELIARGHLINLTKIGARMVGSPENEVYTPALLKDILGRYLGRTWGSLHTAMDEQVSKPGHFGINILSHTNNIMSVYSGLRNIMFRIYTSDPSVDTKKPRPAVLVNCHYDTFMGSPGASDDGVSCAVMLESIRVILKRAPKLQHDIIFLFNGAEENLLQASHAFVTQHPWAKDARTLINLEGAGAGGRQLVFQVSPESMWILEEYAKVARLPFGSVVGQEVFQSGVIPSDTDFRIFRDYGDINGIDLAYVNNGYLYHTSLDQAKHIPPSCMQNAGNNLLELLIALASKADTQHEPVSPPGNPVFFDLFGICMIQISRNLFIWMSIAALVVTCVQIYREMKVEQLYTRRMLSMAILNQLLYFVGLLVVSVSIGTCLHFFGRRMSWYAFRFNIIGLFVFPNISYTFFYRVWIADLLVKCPSPKVAQRLHYQGTQLLFSIFVLMCGGVGAMSIYLIAIWTFTTIILDSIFTFPTLYVSNLLEQHKTRGQILMALLMILTYGFAYTYSSYALHLLFHVFLPIMGRAGNDVQPDIFIGLLSVLASLFPSIYISTYIYQTRRATAKSFAYLFLNCFISYLLIVHFTQVGFPYNTSDDTPRRQRAVTSYFWRTFRNADDTVRHQDSAAWFVTMDQNNVRYMADFIPEVADDKYKAKCEHLPYCGHPHYYPVSMFYQNSYIITDKIPPPRFLLEPQLTVVSKVKSASSSHWNVTFSVTGPSHTHIFLMTEPGVDLVGWSFSTDKPKDVPVPRDTPEKHYFIYYSYGTAPDTPLQFWLDFDVSGDLPDAEKLVQVAVTGIYLYGNYMTPELDTFVARLPKWADSVYWSSYYNHYIVPFSNTK